MKMEVLPVQNQYQSKYGVLGSNKVKDWTSTLTAPASASAEVAAAAGIPYLQSSTTNKIKHSINKSKSSRGADAIGGKQQRLHHATATATVATATVAPSASAVPDLELPVGGRYSNNLFFCDDIDTAAVQELSLRLLDELRAAKSRHLTCTEVSLPCDLTPRIASEIVRVSEREPCGLRGCTIYIEFEDEPSNSRRIASLKIDPETVSTFEVYLTLRQDHRGWTALLPQFMKSLARTITISPEFTITKNKLYSQQSSSSSSSNSYGRPCSSLATPSS